MRQEFQEDVKQLIAVSQLQIITYIQQMFQTQKVEQQINQGVINTYGSTPITAPMKQQNTFSYNLDKQPFSESATHTSGSGAQNQ
eukprot:13196509-Ditylum_brightwellii.AAC.1